LDNVLPLDPTLAPQEVPCFPLEDLRSHFWQVTEKFTVFLLEYELLFSPLLHSHSSAQAQVSFSLQAGVEPELLLLEPENKSSSLSLGEYVISADFLKPDLEKLYHLFYVFQSEYRAFQSRLFDLSIMPHPCNSK
jgi:hypothetical protein